MTKPFDFSAAAKELMSHHESMIYSAAVCCVATERLPDVARSLGWKYIGKGEVLNHREVSRMLVIGVATWAPAELEALDALASAPLPARVLIFDIDQIATQEGLANLLPGNVGHFMRTPFVGEYESGVPKYVLQGDEALQRLKDIARPGV